MAKLDKPVAFWLCSGVLLTALLVLASSTSVEAAQTTSVEILTPGNGDSVPFPLVVTGRVDPTVEWTRVSFETIGFHPTGDYFEFTPEVDGTFELSVHPYNMEDYEDSELTIRISAESDTGLFIDSVDITIDESAIETAGPVVFWNLDAASEINQGFLVEGLITDESPVQSIRVQNGGPNVWWSRPPPPAITDPTSELFDPTTGEFSFRFQAEQQNLRGPEVSVAIIVVDVYGNETIHTSTVTTAPARLTIDPYELQHSFPIQISGLADGGYKGTNKPQVSLTVGDTTVFATTTYGPSGRFTAEFDLRLHRGWVWSPTEEAVILVGMLDNYDQWHEESINIGVLPPVWFYCLGYGVTVDVALGQTGTPGKDVILGTNGNDRILGGSGNDVICGLGGRDLISGGPGHDEIHGGPGADVLLGGSGRDDIYGGGGNDRIRSHRQGDRVHGGNGHDRIRLGGGEDLGLGAVGNDRIFGGPGKDELDGMDGDDYLDGGDHDDLVFGGTGNDRLFGGDGNDRMGGWDGDDRIDGGPGTDLGVGGDGNDGCTVENRRECEYWL